MSLECEGNSYIDPLILISNELCRNWLWNTIIRKTIQHTGKSLHRNKLTRREICMAVRRRAGAATGGRGGPSTPAAYHNFNFMQIFPQDDTVSRRYLLTRSIEARGRRAATGRSCLGAKGESEGRRGGEDSRGRARIGEGGRGWEREGERERGRGRIRAGEAGEAGRVQAAGLLAAPSTETPSDGARVSQRRINNPPICRAT